jgi:flagellin
MAMVINTNMGAMNASRILEQTSLEQSKAAERLTSGKQINSAADNAAGLAVATKMTSQIMGTDQAIKNANDGISMVQTMDGAVEEIVTMLQRMRELGVQAQNGTYTSENRAQMDTEFDQLKLEIDRVAQTTTFNDQFILNGSASSNSNGQIFHVGYDLGTDNKVSVSALNFGVSALSGGGGLVISSLSLANSVSAASTAVGEIDGILSTINTQRASWGAVQNRLESTVSNLANVNENMSAARSRIEDADFATESANLARAQVLSQAGMSMLSQANQNSQNVLSLLR